jgi:hypothetical protein
MTINDVSPTAQHKCQRYQPLRNLSFRIVLARNEAVRPLKSGLMPSRRLVTAEACRLRDVLKGLYAPRVNHGRLQ